MKIKGLVIFLFLLCSNIAFSQSKEPGLSIIFLANDNIADVNIDQDKFIESIKKVTDYCKNRFKDFPETQTFGILVVFHKEGTPAYECYSSPKMDNALHSKILKELSDIKTENTKLVDFPIFISINSKTKDNITGFEGFVLPSAQKRSEYENANLQTKLKLNKEYAINEVLPVLGAYQVIVDDKFEGVKNFGKLISSTNFNETQNISTITSSNKNYWRAAMEMNIGNQLIPTTKIFALVSQGELDHAKKYLEIIRMFSDPKTTTNSYLEEINFRINAFNEDLKKEIEKGIAEHDKGEYQKAITIYNDILKRYPNSSWTLYEKYYSENAKKVAENKASKEEREDWDRSKIEIYKHNPLYNMDVRASNGKEAYLLFRRQEVSSLFKKKEDRLKDIYKYAEIATDLGVYDFAAQLFWITATFDKGNFQNSLNNYLYCLDKLGEKELKSNFKYDFDKIFKEIDENKENEMKKSSIYNSMKN